MNICDQYAVLLSGFVDGALTSDEEARLRAHLAECPACSAGLRDLLAIHESFPRLEDVPVPEGFTASVMAAVRAGGPQRDAAPKRSGRRWWRAAVPLAACLALLAVLGSQRPLPPGGTEAGQAGLSSPAVAPQPAAGDSAGESDTPSTLMIADEDAPAQDAADAEALVPQDAAQAPGDPIESLDPAQSGLATSKNAGAGVEDAEYAAVLHLTQEEAAVLLADRVPELTSETEARYVLTVADALLLLPQAEAGEDAPEMEAARLPDSLLETPEDVKSEYVLIIVTLAQ